MTVLSFSECDLCGKQFQMSNGKYDGKFIPTYGVSVCMPHYIGNHDGWSPSSEAKIIAIAKSSGKTIPDRNEKGWLPRD